VVIVNGALRSDVAVPGERYNALFHYRDASVEARAEGKEAAKRVGRLRRLAGKREAEGGDGDDSDDDFASAPPRRPALQDSDDEEAAAAAAPAVEAAAAAPDAGSESDSEAELTDDDGAPPPPPPARLVGGSDPESVRRREFFPRSPPMTSCARARARAAAFAPPPPRVAWRLLVADGAAGGAAGGGGASAALDAAAARAERESAWDALARPGCGADGDVWASGPPPRMPAATATLYRPCGGGYADAAEAALPVEGASGAAGPARAWWPAPPAGAHRAEAEAEAAAASTAARRMRAEDSPFLVRAARGTYACLPSSQSSGALLDVGGWLRAVCALERLKRAGGGADAAGGGRATRATRGDKPHYLQKIGSVDLGHTGGSEGPRLLAEIEAGCFV
jgi:hypothetical protein